MFIEAYSPEGDWSNIALQTFQRYCDSRLLDGVSATIHVRKEGSHFRVFLCYKDDFGHEFKIHRNGNSIEKAMASCVKKVSYKYRRTTKKYEVA